MYVHTQMVLMGYLGDIQVDQLWVMCEERMSSEQQ
jgi:hypothetical protein